MNERRSKGCLIAAVVWIVILGTLAVAYRYLVHPRLSQRLTQATGSSSQYRHEVVVAADSFSGYCVLRSEAVKQDLKGQQIRLTVQDDRADYPARLQALRDGKIQLAAFTIDSFILAGARAGDFPGSIVLVIDETKGGDALVAYRDGVPSLQDLNRPEARIVATANSPSEFLARVVLAHFNLPNLPSNWLVPADNAAAVYRQFRAANPRDRQAFVLWEPYVSRALETPGAHVLIDSSRLKGYVVDILVAQRQFLRDHPEVVQAVIEAYARAAYAVSQQPDGWVRLVMEDSRKSGTEALDEAQARKVVQGIQWRNTLENYAHFGLETGVAAGGLPVLEDMIANIIDVLVKTRVLTEDPLAGSHAALFFDRILADLRRSGFHPGQDLAGAPGSATAAETVRGDQALAALSPEQWSALRPVGELRMAPLTFSRGSAALTLDSERALQNLAHRLESFPQFYLRVIGQARPEGDPEANRVLALTRAEAAGAFLTQHGVPAARVRTESAPTTAQGGEAQSVVFVVGQLPY